MHHTGVSMAGDSPTIVGYKKTQIENLQRGNLANDNWLLSPLGRQLPND